MTAPSVIEEPVSFQHPDLGDIKGVVVSESTVQFRAIPFASAPERFRQAQLIEPPLKSNDFTAYGPICPQVEDPCAVGFGYGGPLKGSDTLYASEDDCLNLTITAPLNLPADKKVPILFWIHGGSFLTGCGANNPLEDGKDVVAQSIRKGAPVIQVGIQYRLGYLGFLACKDLVEECQQNGDSPCNFALHDQRLALLWVKKYLSGFGGDINNITCMGESAGSISTAYHLLINPSLISSSSPPFHKAILQSGTATTLPPAPLEIHERFYQELCQRFNITQGRYPTAAGRLAALRALPVERLVEESLNKNKLGYLYFVPLDDSEYQESPLYPNPPFFVDTLTLENEARLISRCPWIDTIVVGDCLREADFFLDAFLRVKNPSQFVLDTIRKDLDGKGEADDIITAYGLTPNMDFKTEFLVKVGELMGDCLFNARAYHLAMCLAIQSRIKAYYYHFDKTNPFPGTIYHGVCHHWLDNIYFFQQVADRLEDFDPAERAFGAEYLDLFLSVITSNPSVSQLQWPRFGFSNDTRSLDVVIFGESGTHKNVVVNEVYDLEVNHRPMHRWQTVINIGSKIDRLMLDLEDPSDAPLLEHGSNLDD